MPKHTREEPKQNVIKLNAMQRDDKRIGELGSWDAVAPSLKHVRIEFLVSLIKSCVGSKKHQMFCSVTVAFHRPINLCPTSRMQFEMDSFIQSHSHTSV